MPGGQHQDRHPAPLAQPPDDVDSVHVGQADVQQHDVRAGGVHHLQGLAAVARLADHLHVGFPGEQRGHQLPHQALVLGDDDPDRHANVPAMTAESIPRLGNSV